MKKKVLSIVLALFMLLGLVTTFATPAQAAEDLFNIKNGVLVRYGDEFGSPGPENVVIPNSVTEIGDSAFYDHNEIKSVSIPNSVEKIGDNAFWGCSGLNSITIPVSVKDIGKNSLGWDRAGSLHTPHDGFIIYGTTGSAAEQYAANATTTDGNHFIKFVSISTAKPTNPHPYATALGDYFKDATGNTAAYLADINSDGTPEMLATKDYSCRLFYFFNGKLFTYDFSSLNEEVGFSAYNRIVFTMSTGTHTTWNILTIKNGKAMIETSFYIYRGESGEIAGYAQNDKEISQSAYNALLKKYGLSQSATGYAIVNQHPDQTAEILAMTTDVKVADTSQSTAKPTTSKVLVNGKEVAFDAYTINGNNYFKLRDLAKVVSGTTKQFEVTWDGSKNAINLVSGKAYTSVGGELSKGDGVSKQATLSTSTIYKDSVKLELTAYTINGNNYFKLRDVAKALNIGVTWDGTTSTVGIDTTISYVE